MQNAVPICITVSPHDSRIPASYFCSFSVTITASRILSLANFKNKKINEKTIIHYVIPMQFDVKKFLILRLTLQCVFFLELKQYVISE